MQNKGLAALAPMVGEWEFTMYNCWFLDSLETEVKGFTTIEWLRDAFLVIRSTDADRKPDDVWVIGYSDPQARYEMFYHDQRGVSRIFHATFDGSRFVFSREDSDFHQRLTLDMGADEMHSVAEASEDEGETWRVDLEMRFVRLDAGSSGG